MADAVVPRAIARDAADDILERRYKALTGSPQLADLGDTLEDVLGHVAATRDRTGRDLLGLDDGLDPELVRQDVTGAFVILDYLAGHYARQLARWRLGLYEAGRRAGMGPTAFMTPMHQRHRQGVLEVVKRDRALLSRPVGASSDDDTRAVADGARDNAAAERTAGAELRDLAETLVSLRLALPGDIEDATGYDVDDLAGAIGDPGFVPILRLVVRHLLTAQVSDEVRDVLDHTYAHLVDQLGLRGAGDMT